MGNSNWEIKPLKELCSSIGDGLHGTPKYIDDSDYYFVNGNNLKNGFIVTTENTKKVGLEEYQKYFLEFDDNTLFMSINGTLGNLAFYKSEKVILGKSAAYINCKSIDRKFLYYYLQLDYVQKKMWDEATGSTIKNLSLESLKNFPIPVPSPETQQKIAAVLSALDAKIELNARINAELESMAKTAFRYQFVENKEKGNWEIGTLGDIAENIRRSANPNEIKPETHYIGLEHMPRKSIALAEYGNASELESNKYAFKTGEFLFGKLRPYFHKVGIAPVEGVCSTDILVIAPKSPEWYGFVLGQISSDELIKYADATSGGTKMPRTNWESLSRFEISIPPVELAAKFSEFFIPVASQIRANILESQTLTEVRDWLLPMLMNGQVQVQT